MSNLGHETVLIASQKQIRRILVRSIVNYHYPRLKITESTNLPSTILKASSSEIDIVVMCEDLIDSNERSVLKSLHENNSHAKIILISQALNTNEDDMLAKYHTAIIHPPISENSVLNGFEQFAV